MLGIFLDSETNGLNYKKHRVIDIAFKIIDVYTGELKDEFQTVIALSPQDWDKSDPESLKVNGYTWGEVSKGIPVEQATVKILELFARHNIKRKEAVFICQNPSFDRVFFSQLIDPDVQEKLLWPYHWLDLASMYWAEAIRKSGDGTTQLPWDTGVSKDKIATTLKLPREAHPHRAMNGVNHLLLCYKAVVGFPQEQN